MIAISSSIFYATAMITLFSGRREEENLSPLLKEIAKHLASTVAEVVFLKREPYAALSLLTAYIFTHVMLERRGDVQIEWKLEEEFPESEQRTSCSSKQR